MIVYVVANTITIQSRPRRPLLFKENYLNGYHQNHGHVHLFLVSTNLFTCVHLFQQTYYMRILNSYAD